MQQILKNRNTKGTFQGIVLIEIAKIIEKHPELNFSKITQNENIGITKNIFASLILYSSKDSTKKVLFEIISFGKPTNSADVVDNFRKRLFQFGFSYCVSISPTEYTIFNPYIEGVSFHDRYVKVDKIDDIKQRDILFDFYVNNLKTKLLEMLRFLNQNLHSEL